MSLPEKPQQDAAGTYVVLDRASKIELERLHLQDEMATIAMGGVLAEQEHPEELRRVLDVGCATGGWLIATAQAYPEIKSLIGVDISPTMIAFAREKAREAGVADRVDFQVGDALRMLEFPDSFFGLVNQRAGASYLRSWDWPKLLQEYQRVTQPTGIIRITEGGNIESNSPAFGRFWQLLIQTVHQAGNYFEPDGDSIIKHLVPLLQQHGLRNVQTASSIAEYHAGTTQGNLFFEDFTRLFRTIEPFLRRWTRLPDDYQAICQQATEEMQRPDFVARTKGLTAWGSPRYKKDVPVRGTAGY